ncbi:MAG: Ldh family oxidoreductase [Spirochaetes bacterium]|nr:Ldh family oxidoreductase [Spirochaetota bacterium]
MKIDSKKLEAGAFEILIRMGETEQNARIASGILVNADMRGISTHGVNLLRMMHNRVKAGMLQLPTRTTIVEDRNGTTVMDGNNGIGQVSAFHCLELTTEKAKKYGLSMVLLRKTNNIGALGYYTSVAARKGLIQLLMTNGNPSMAPYGAAEPFFGTNPISIGIPVEGERPVFLDMSSSVVARGKIRLASLRGESIPEGWALDENGDPTTDPKKALKGCMLPLGGPKGSGLAMIVDILSGVLSGSSFSKAIKSFHTLEGPTGVGACFIGIDPNRFMPMEQFSTLVRKYVEDMKGLKKQKGFTEILAPGELELNREERSAKEGIEVPDEVIRELDTMCKELGSSFSFQ